MTNRLMRACCPALVGALLLATPALPAAAQAQQPAAIDRAWLVGTWADREDCSGAVRFQRDGRFVVLASGAEGRWRLERNVIVLIGQDREQPMPIRRLGRHQLIATESGVISYRCDGPNNTRSR